MPDRRQDGREVAAQLRLVRWEIIATALKWIRRALLFDGRLPAPVCINLSLTGAALKEALELKHTD